MRNKAGSSKASDADDTESKSETAFICRSGDGCGCRINVPVPGGTDEEKAASGRHPAGHEKIYSHNPASLNICIRLTS